ncbi:hypothetical protein FND50_09695 [Rhodococcus sp. WB9]|nr:hypothetical protein FND50_09695 [Rhodococcus sp. WB9]
MTISGAQSDGWVAVTFTVPDSPSAASRNRQNIAVATRSSARVSEPAYSIPAGSPTRARKSRTAPVDSVPGSPS